MTMSRVAPAGVPTGRPRKTNRKIPLGVMGRHHLNTIEKTLKTDPDNFIHSLPLIPTTRTSFLPESRDALKKPSAPTFDQPELPFKQKLSTRAKETILKWKNDLPSPPSFLTSWASKFLAFASRTKTSSTSSFSQDSLKSTDFSRSMWESRTCHTSPQTFENSPSSLSVSLQTESLQVLHGPMRHFADRDPPNSYPLVEPIESSVLKSAKAFSDMGISGGLAHFIPSNIMVSGFTHTCRSDEGSDATLTHLSPAITPDQSSSEISRVVPVSPEPRNIWPFKSLMVSKRLSQILNIKKPAEGRPVGISLVPLGTSIAETQTPPERTRDSKGTVRKDRRHNKERSRRKDRSKSRDRDRYEEIMEVEYNRVLPKTRIKKNEERKISRKETYPKIDLNSVLVKADPDDGKEKEEGNYDSDDEDMSCGHWCEYVIVVVLSSILLVASVVLVLFWCLYYKKGYAWNDNPNLQFNLHPTLMITGFVFFSGFSMLLYRISRCCRRIYVKLLHTLFHTLAIPCVVLGFMAVLDFHNLADPPIPNFLSIHSWMGFVTMGLFALQFVVGFFSFLLLLCCDSATAGFRASLVPVHATFGLTTFMLAIATCLTGLTQKSPSSPGSSFSNYPEETIIVNTLAMVLVALAILVSYAVRREPLRVHSISYVSERL